MIIIVIFIIIMIIVIIIIIIIIISQPCKPLLTIDPYLDAAKFPMVQHQQPWLATSRLFQSQISSHGDGIPTVTSECPSVYLSGINYTDVWKYIMKKWIIVGLLFSMPMVFRCSLTKDKKYIDCHCLYILHRWISLHLSHAFNATFWSGEMKKWPFGTYRLTSVYLGLVSCLVREASVVQW